MEIYTALFDIAGQPSTHVGAFSSEKRARDACQEHFAQNSEANGPASASLIWTEDRAMPQNGDTYTVILTMLDDLP